MEHRNLGLRAKRPFSQIEDADDFVPISKRINNLNIKGPRNSQDEPPAGLQANDGAFSMENPAEPGNGGNPLPLNHMPLPNFPFAQLPDCPRPGHPHQQQYFPPPSLYSPHMGGGPSTSYFPPQLHQGPAPGFQPPSQSPQASQQQLPSNMFYHHSHHPSAPLSPPHQVNSSPEVPSSDHPQDDEHMGTDSDYDPELGETDNPHYYHINYLLFQAHCQRMRRGGHSGSPTLS
ncbi:uncharacterized protein LOC143291845 [Babylonia areolata]|uniref:uncharacterized protein LOC143291845 n=1 Tax=Babylonia areolata TaxID=304850 RepID=UPI003FD1CF9A